MGSSYPSRILSGSRRQERTNSAKHRPDRIEFQNLSEDLLEIFRDIRPKEVLLFFIYFLNVGVELEFAMVPYNVTKEQSSCAREIVDLDVVTPMVLVTKSYMDVDVSTYSHSGSRGKGIKGVEWYIAMEPKGFPKKPIDTGLPPPISVLPHN